MLHREVRLACRAHTCVVESRDVRMSQRREDVALALEALDELTLARSLERQLQRHVALQLAIRALGEPHRAHAAAADFADQAIPADLLADAGGSFEQRMPHRIDRERRQKTALLEVGV